MRAGALTDTKIIVDNDYTVSLDRSAFVLHVIQNNFIVGVFQCNPAAGKLAPQLTVHGSGSVNGDDFALVQHADPLVVGTSTIANIDKRIGHSDLNRILAGNDGIRNNTAQLDPAAIRQLAPLDILGIHIVSHDRKCSSCFHSTGNLCICCGLLKYRQRADICSGICICSSSTQHVALCIQLAFTLLPVGIQSHFGSGVIQGGDPLATVLLSVPTQETVVGLERNRTGDGRLICIITLHQYIQNTVNRIEQDVGHILTATLQMGIDTVQIHIGFAQSALQKARQNLQRLTRSAPTCHLIDKIVAGITVDDGLHQITAAGQPTCAEIVCKQRQCIILILLQGQVVLGNELAQLYLHTRYGLTQIFFCLRFRNGSGHTFLPVCTVTNTIMLIVPVTIGMESFEFLQYVNCILTDGHFTICGCAQRCDRNQTHQQDS